MDLHDNCLAGERDGQARREGESLSHSGDRSVGNLPGHMLSLWSRLDSTLENDNFQFGGPLNTKTIRRDRRTLGTEALRDKRGLK